MHELHSTMHELHTTMHELHSTMHELHTTVQELHAAMHESTHHKACMKAVFLAGTACCLPCLHQCCASTDWCTICISMSHYKVKSCSTEIHDRLNASANACQAVWMSAVSDICDVHVRNTRLPLLAVLI